MGSCQAQSLDLMELPQDAADMLGLAVQSSGLQGQWPQPTEPRPQPGPRINQQFLLQPTQDVSRKFIQIGGDNYHLTREGSGEGDQMVIQAEQPPQPAQQILYHHEQQMLMQENNPLQQQQLMMTENHQMLLNQEQPVYVDELGRQLLLSPEQQLMIQQQQLGGQQLQLIQGVEGGEAQVLVAYQDEDQDQEVVYDDQDVMTID